MHYTVNPILTELRPEVLARLQVGELRRVGGVLRVAPGYPHAGSIAAHLRETGDFVRTPAHAALGLSQVAAAASVVNLGVSIAGFALVLHKIGKLQSSVNALTALTARQHDAVMGALRGISAQLVELQYIALESRDLLEATLDEVRRVRRDLLDMYLARVLTEVELLQRAPQLDDPTVTQTMRTFGEARRWLELTIAALPAMARDDAHWFDRLLRYRVWCFVGQAEVALLRRIGDDQGAATLARSLATTSRVWVQGWRDVLLPMGEFHGVFRFSHSAFSELDGEVYERLVRLQAGPSGSGADASEVDARMAVARAMPRLGAAWVERQRAMAGLLDFAEETTARLESVADEMQMCVSERMPYAFWEGLVAPGDQAGLLLIERGAR